MSMTDPTGDEPVRVFEDADTGDRFLIYGDGGGGQWVQLSYQGDALWMTQAQMAELFGRDVSVISRHITNILEEGELPEEGSLQKMQTTQGGRPGTLYSLDMIISVGYRVSSAQATLFRRWATAILVRFATKGFVVDVNRLKAPGDTDRIAELREIIRDIRSSEANIYAELRRICAMCQDYESSSGQAITFYQRMQAKLFYAVTTRTPSEIQKSRADAKAPNMGLQVWGGKSVLIYGDGGGVRVQLSYQGDALWMTQAQMAELFGRDVSVISRHITNILEEGELPEEGSLQKMQTTQGGRPGTLYSLDMIISVGYRVSSRAGRSSSLGNRHLVRFATTGFVVDVNRLKAPGDTDRIAELREIIRDIRSSEANIYAELRRICAMCQDYESSSGQAITFYQRMQAKLFYAVTTRTPSEIQKSRADAKAPNMGLQVWGGKSVTKRDALVAKNYLAPGEIEELNRLTTLLLDIFDDQAKIGRLVRMEQANRLLDSQLTNLGRQVLNHGGQIGHSDAEATATREYDKFDAKRRAARKAAADEEYAALKALEKSLPKKRGRKSD